MASRKQHLQLPDYRRSVLVNYTDDYDPDYGFDDPEEDVAYPEPHSIDDPWWFGMRSDW